MAAVSGTLKRVRAWEYCDDLLELKRLLTDQDDEITKLRKELDAVKGPPKVANGKDSPKVASAISLAQVSKLRRAVKQQISARMVYLTSLKCDQAPVTAEVSNLTEPEFRAILGDFLEKKMKSGPELLSVDANSDHIELICGPIRKSLRYGAKLQPTDEFKFVYHKADNVLKISGYYKMDK